VREGAGGGGQQMGQEVTATRRHAREGAGAGYQAAREGESRAPAAREGGSRRWHYGGQV
jgi:hypothetical protein